MTVPFHPLQRLLRGFLTATFVAVAALSSAVATAHASEATDAQAATAPALAAAPAPAPAPYRVGVFVSPPFVTKDAKGEYSGYAWELYSAAERRLEIKSVPQEFATFAELLNAVIAGKIDIAVTDMFITSDRARRMDFTHPIADGGLRVMISTEHETRLDAVWRDLIEAGHARILGWGALIVITLAIPLAFFWRHVDKDFPQKPLDAFAESLYRLVTVTMSGRTKVTSVSTWHTKVFAAGWLVVGVSIVAYITSTVTSVMTKQALRGSINSVADLNERTVGMVTGTLGEQYCRANGLDVLGYPTLDKAVEALIAHEVGAIVHDGLALEAYDHTHPKLPLTEVGPIFDKRRYGIGLPTGSALRQPLNVALIELSESGTTDTLYTKYFGN